MSQSHVIFELQ